jgi:SOS-response transcriptional repressor LexA
VHRLNCTGYARLECGIAFSWNSELPSGHNPFWIRDDALAGLGLRAGDAVAIDTSAQPRDGDLVVAEADIDGDSVRLARRYFVAGSEVRLEPVGSVEAVLVLPQDNVLVLGVIAARLRFASGTDQPPLEEPL